MKKRRVLILYQKKEPKMHLKVRIPGGGDGSRRLFPEKLKKFSL